MLTLGFRTIWVDTVIRCVESATFSFVLNGSPRGHVVLGRRLRQGDPILPSLFLFVSEGLIHLLRKAEEDGSLKGHSVCCDAPPISHLFFADDSVFSCKAALSHA